MSGPDPEQAARVVAAFDAGARDLPWRAAPAGRRPAYAVWVAEIMLQQTRVDVVVPYFQAWMQAFPTVEALAAAAEDEVLRHWSGLGYYRRARLLHAGAQELVARGARGTGGPAWPHGRAAWLEIPGIGAYTAAALASLADDEAAAVVDGNVKRVVARLEALELARDERALHQAAAAWMERGMTALGPELRPGHWNEAVMEFGAVWCTPRAPRCPGCPLHDRCRANELARAGGAAVESYPAAPRRQATREVELVYGLAQAEGSRVLLVQREQGWNPGLWEPPSITLAGGASAAVQEAWEQSAGPGRLGEELGQLRHAITRHRITARVHRLEGVDHLAHQDPARLGLTGLARKILRRWV